MTEQQQENLKNIGFSDVEAAIYVALLELGRGSVSQIALRAKVNRTSGYHVLSSFVAKGLAIISGREPKQEFVAEPPRRLTRFIQRELERQKGLAARTEALVPSLEAIYHHGDRPRVRFFEGTKGLQDVYEDTLTSHEPIRAFASIEDMHKALPDYFPKYYERRARKGIHIRGIVPDSPTARERMKHNKEEMREAMLVPEKQFRFSPEINIYDNKLMIASWREKLGIIIESQEIADAMKKVYELAWAEAERQDAKLRQT